MSEGAFVSAHLPAHQLLFALKQLQTKHRGSSFLIGKNYKNECNLDELKPLNSSIIYLKTGCVICCLFPFRMCLLTTAGW